MTGKVLVDARIYAGGFDFSGDANQVELALTADDVVMTPFGYGGGTKRKAGLTDASFSMQGFTDFDADAQDARLDSVVRVNNTPITVADTDVTGAQAEGDPATFGRGVLLDYSPLQSAVGEAATFEASGMISGIVIPGGMVLHPDTSRTASGTGSNVALGALIAGESCYAILHVVAVSGTAPTLDVVVKSGSTDRITFAEASAVGSQWGIPVQGPITQANWSIEYTIGGTNPAFTFVVAAGFR